MCDVHGIEDVLGAFLLACVLGALLAVPAFGIWLCEKSRG
jgi:membrane-associated phospholipid phosphatase